MVSNEELEVHVEKARPNAKRDSEDDLECDQIDNYENTGPRRRQWLAIERETLDGEKERAGNTQ